MADLRLLRAASALLALSVATACSREIEVPRIAGQLLDERTGKPIESAALYLGFSGKSHLAIGGPAATGRIDERVAMTDGNGQFEFPAHSFRLDRFTSLMREHPGIVIVHPKYGDAVEFLSDDRTTWDRVVWRIKPHEARLRSLERDCEALCGGLGHRAYYHCYEMLCGQPFPEKRKVPEDRR